MLAAALDAIYSKGCCLRNRLTESLVPQGRPTTLEARRRTTFDIAIATVPTTSTSIASVVDCSDAVTAPTAPTACSDPVTQRAPNQRIAFRFSLAANRFFPTTLHTSTTYNTFRLPCAYLWLSPPSARSARRLRLPTIRFEQNPPAGWPSSSAAVLRSGRSVRRRRRTAGCRQSSTPLRSMATTAASVANRLIIIAMGVLPMPAAMVDGRIALGHHESGLGVQPVN